MTDLTEIEARRMGAIRRDLHWITERWDDLHETRHKGTPRPWRQPTLTPAAQEALDAQARIERRERSHLAPGEHPAPVHVDVLDLLAHILMRADMLHEHIAQTIGQDRLPPAASAFDDARPYLRFINEHLRAAFELDPEMLDAVSDVTRELKTEMARTLGEVFDGQTLHALCAYCGGRDNKHPTGGGETLRVRLLWMPTPDNREHHEPAIVCEGGMCEPPESDCGLWHKGRPAWPWHEWDWLSKRLDRPA